MPNSRLFQAALTPIGRRAFQTSNSVWSAMGASLDRSGGNAMKLRRRNLLHLAAGAAALPAVLRVAWAQGYPTRPVTTVVPFAAGGTTDVTGRGVGEHMSRTRGQQVVVENISGAGGTIGSVRAMRARSDGYTILMASIGTHAFSVSLYP